MLAAHSVGVFVGLVATLATIPMIFIGMFNVAFTVMGAHPSMECWQCEVAFRSFWLSALALITIGIGSIYLFKRRHRVAAALLALGAVVALVATTQVVAGWEAVTNRQVELFDYVRNWEMTASGLVASAGATIAATVSLIAVSARGSRLDDEVID